MADLEQNNRPALTTRQKRIMIYFIEATRALLQSEGIEGLSIRKIATEAGYNSATLYNYFSDLEHLTLFGSACYLRDYVLSLSRSLRPEMSALERFRTIYHCFNEIAFQYPDIFHNMFFGKHSARLGAVLQTYYYDLFPEELAGIGEPMRTMMVSGTMPERDRVTMEAMVAEGFVAPEKAEHTLNLIIALHQSFIHDACVQGEDLDVARHKRRFNELFEYVLAQAK